MADILNLLPDELGQIIISYGEKKFRAAQIFGWLAKGAASFDEMKNIPAGLRAKLAASGWYIGHPDAAGIQRSKDGTVKCLFRFRSGSVVGSEQENGTEVESVFMRYEYGNSICISSQAGCRMGCSFCASTMDGLQRSLSGGEMLGEVLAMRNLIRRMGAGTQDQMKSSEKAAFEASGETINHVVIMGMGEPFDNYDEVGRFIKLIHDPKGYGLSLRNITVSTCGIIPGIEKFAEDFPQVNLAVSLHAPNQALRERTMPVARKYSYDELMRACLSYTEKTGRRITFEYAVIDGVNDSTECASELAGRLKGWLTHVNLIPLNEVSGRSYRKASGNRVAAFKRILEDAGVAVTVRRTLGADIDAACGQLRRRGTAHGQNQ